jgi:spore maturation protein CgeB
MRIAFFGSSLVSSYWNGAATYYRGLLKALAELGHSITFYEPDAYQRQQHRDIPDPPWARVIVYPASSDGWRSSFDAAARSCDLLVKASGVGVFDADMEIAAPQCKRPGLSIAFWDVDAPATLESAEADPRHHLRATIPNYDLILTYGGGAAVVAAYRRLGARQCVPIYNALDPQTHHPDVARAAFQCDLSLLANRLPDREARIDEFFLLPAARLPGSSFLLGGAGWGDKPMPSNVRLTGHVGTADHNAFFCSGRATLNVNRASMARYGFSPPTRIFEAAGAGACIITDAWDGIEEFLEPGREIIVAEYGEAVVQAMRELTPATARKLAAAARRRVLSEHTYVHRARQVDRLLEHYGASEVAA